MIGIGVIGAGVMGAEHARLIAGGAGRLVAVADADPARAAAAAGRGAAAVTDPLALIAAPEVEAVIVASPDPTHHPLVAACLAAGKPVLCEKPLAATAAEALALARADAGRGLVHVGFMRRFDPAYAEIRAALPALGTLHLVHNQHRNQSAPPWFTAEMAITNSFVHEIDVSRWLTGEEFVAATVLTPRRAGAGLSDLPLLVVLETEGGALVSTEVFINAAYGYHVHVEAVCAGGTVAMAQPALTRTRRAGAERADFPENWVPRFAEAYRRQDAAWVEALAEGRAPEGAATAWDGYVATAVAEQVLGALARPGTRVPLSLPPRP